MRHLTNKRGKQQDNMRQGVLLPIVLDVFMKVIMYSYATDHNYP